jgi:fibronectin-binding autotransporter adhesin
MLPSRIRRVLVLLTLIGAFHSIPSYAQVVATWTDGSGNWSNPLNWSTNPVVPNDGGGNFYNVTINGTGSDTVTFDASGTVVSNLTIGTGETLQNNGFAQTLTIGDRNVPGSGSVTNNGTISWGNGSTLSALGDFSVATASTLNLSGGSSAIINGDFHLYHLGVTSLNGSNLSVGGNYHTIVGGRTKLTNGSIVTIGGSYEGYISQGQQYDILSVDASTLTVGGNLASDSSSFSNGSALKVQGSLSNGPDDLGLFSLSGRSSAVINGDFTNLVLSSAYIDNSTLTVSGSVSNPDFGRMSLHNGAILSVGGDFRNVVGTLSISGGSAGKVSGNFINYHGGDVSIGGSILNVTGSFTTSGTVAIDPTAILTTTSYSQSGANASTGVSGHLSTGSYLQSGGTTTIESGGKITATTFQATGGTVTVNGILDPTAVEFGSGATLQGTGTIIGNVAMGGIFTVGASGTPGTFTINGNYEQLGGGILDEYMSPLSQSLLDVNGNMTLDSGSILNIILLDGFNPLGQTFNLMDYNSLSGEFANGSIFSEDGYVWDIHYGEDGIDLRAVATPEPNSLLLLGLGLAALTWFGRRKNRSRFSA